MKIRKIFLPILTVLFVGILAMIPPQTQKSPIRAVTIFSGSIMFGNVSAPRPDFIEMYKNHREQAQTIPIVYDGQGHATYYVAIPTENLDIGSVIKFVAGDDKMVLGFDTLDGKKHTKDLIPDAQSQ